MPVAELYIAKSLSALNKNREAIEKFTSITKLYPTTDSTAEALLWLGDYYLDEGKYLLAIPLYNQFLTVFAGNVKTNLVYYELGQSYQSAGQLDKL